MSYRTAQAGSISPRNAGKTVQSHNAPQVVEASVLAKAKATRIGQLRQSVINYEAQFFCDGEFALIDDARSQGNKKALKVRQWSQSLWRDYYVRKDDVDAKTAVESVGVVSLDFSNHSAPPYSVREILDEIKA